MLEMLSHLKIIIDAIAIIIKVIIIRMNIIRVIINTIIVIIILTISMIPAYFLVASAMTGIPNTSTALSRLTFKYLYVVIWIVSEKAFSFEM